MIYFDFIQWMELLAPYILKYSLNIQKTGQLALCLQPAAKTDGGANTWAQPVDTALCDITKHLITRAAKSWEASGVEEGTF